MSNPDPSFFVSSFSPVIIYDQKIIEVSGINLSEASKACLEIRGKTIELPITKISNGALDIDISSFTDPNCMFMILLSDNNGGTSYLGPFIKGVLAV